MTREKALSKVKGYVGNAINREEAIDAVMKCSVKDVTPTYMLIDQVDVLNTLMHLPTIQSDLIYKIQNAINVTQANDNYARGMRNGMRWCLSLIDGKAPLLENCPPPQCELTCDGCKHRGKWENEVEKRL